MIAGFSVGRALHRYRRGHRVRIPYRPDFFEGFLFTTAKVVSITAMIFFLSNSFFRSSNI